MVITLSDRWKMHIIDWCDGDFLVEFFLVEVQVGRGMINIRTGKKHYWPLTRLPLGCQEVAIKCATLMDNGLLTGLYWVYDHTFAEMLLELIPAG